MSIAHSGGMERVKQSSAALYIGPRFVSEKSAAMAAMDSSVGSTKYKAGMSGSGCLIFVNDKVIRMLKG